MEIPAWWLILSGLFFTVNLVFFIVLCVALVRMMKVAEELKPKVDRISNRVDSISVKVDEMATTLNETVKKVSEKTSSVAADAEMITHVGAENFGKYAPILATIGTVVKVVQIMRQLGIKMPSRRKHD
jgi:phage-related minor tail protein